MNEKKIYWYGSILLIWLVIVFGVVISLFFVGPTEPSFKSSEKKVGVETQKAIINDEFERARMSLQAEEDRIASEEAKRLISERVAEETARKKVLEENAKKIEDKLMIQKIGEKSEETRSRPEGQEFIAHGKETIKGNVIDLISNKPIEGVMVKLYTKEGLFLRMSESDAKGFFELPSVITENVLLRAYKKGFISGVFKSFSSDELKLHVMLKLDPGQIIKGKVVDKLTNSPVKLASLQLYKGPSLIEAGVVTDAKGEFIIEGVPDGPVDLAIQKDGYSDSNTTLNIMNQKLENVSIALERAFQVTIELRVPGEFKMIPKISVYFDDAKTGLYFERSVLTTDQNKNIFRVNGLSKLYSRVRVHAFGYEFTENQNLTMRPGEEAVVVYDLSEGLSVSGVVKDENQKPVANLPVIVYEVFGGGRAVGDDVLKGEFVTDEKGIFKVTGIKPGNVEFIIENTIYKKVKVKHVVHSDVQEFIEINVEIENFFTGVLKSKSGKTPIANEVRFIPILPGGKIDSSRPMPKYNGVATIEGFNVSGVTSGLYRVTITANGYKALILDEYNIEEKQVRGAFEMQEGHSITGKVLVLGSNGTPIGGADIHFVTVVEGSNVKHHTKSDVRGFYSIDGLEVGSVYRCQADAIGYQFKTFEQLIDENTNEVNIELEAKKMFSGIVVDAISKAPVTQFTVKIFGKIGVGLVSGNNQTFNSSNGQFSIPINDEKFSIEITSPNYGYLRVNDIFATDPIRNYYLPKGARLEITVYEDQKVGSMKSVVVSETPDPLPSTSWSYVTNSEGKVFVSNLREGLYYLRVRSNGKAVSNEVIQVVSEVDNKIDIKLKPGFTLSGRLIDKATNIPISSGLVWLDPGIYSDRPIRARLGKDGMFKINNVSPGPHSLKIEFGQMVKMNEYSNSMTKNIEVPGVVANKEGVFSLDTIYIEK